MDSQSIFELINQYEHLESAVVLLLDSPNDLREHYMRLVSDALTKVNQTRYNLNANFNSNNSTETVQDDY